MTAPKLEKMKFWIVKPKAGTNQILNPRFDTPTGITGWTAFGAGVTLASTGDHQRRGAYSMQVNPATNVASGAYMGAMSVTNTLSYTFSVDVKGVAGQSMRIYIADVAGTVKAVKPFIATGYWQRMEVHHTSAATIGTYRVYVIRDSIASIAPFYVDGAQFEQASKATTFMHGYAGNGYSWSGLPQQSTSIRSAFTKSGGELLCINDYARIINVYGFGMGQFNQIMTKMTSGGDMYQGSLRQSRNVSLVLAYEGANPGEIQAKRKIILDAVRPDLLDGQEMVLRYQGFDVNGVEATNPVDIRCVFQPSHVDTPDTSVYQKDILAFTIPSGLLQGAYDDGKELDLYADFPAEFIVKRDPQGNWCTFNYSTGFYDPSITGLNGQVNDIKEAPNGDIYVCGYFTNAGGVALADYVARWSKVSQAWQAVGDPVTGATITGIRCMAFDAAGDLYVGGDFTNLAGIANADYFAKYTLGTGAPAAWAAVGSGLDSVVNTIVISPAGTIYIGGNFTTASGNTNCNYIAYLSGSTWTPLATGLPGTVYVMRFMPDGIKLIIGGSFTNATGTAGDCICGWDGTAFHSYTEFGATELNNTVIDIDITPSGAIVIGGAFTNAGDDANADYVAMWRGNNWGALDAGGVNNYVQTVSCLDNGDIYLSGDFSVAGSLTLVDRIVKSVQGTYQKVDIDLPGTASVFSVLKASDGSLYLGGLFSTAALTPDVNAKTGVVAINLEVSSASANVYPFVQVRGPGTLKSIANYSTNKSVLFDGLTLQVGESIFLYFDPTNLKFISTWGGGIGERHSGGRGNVMRYVVAGSDYGEFYLKPGTNYLSLFMTDTTAASGAFMYWSPQFWGLDGALL